MTSLADFLKYHILMVVFIRYKYKNPFVNSQNRKKEGVETTVKKG